MNRILATTALLACACGLDPATEAFRDGFPRAETVKLTVPGSSSAQPLTSTPQRRDALEGDTAQFYAFTRGVTVTVNGGLVATLSLVERITDSPATTTTPDMAIWGPHTEPLSPNTWRFTVTRRAPNDYAYQLEGKGKTEPDSAFRVVLSGTHAPAGRLYGNGSLKIDWQAASTLPEHDANTGSVSATYSRAAAGAPTQVEATFSQVKNDSQLVDATYHFTQTPGQGGSLEFQMNKDITATPAVEVLSVRSRWLDSGAGRSDVRVSGGDLTSPATANECWDATFASRFFVTTWDPSQTWGASSVCAFASPEYARN